ncbi:hypothetical protein SERLA73DRAFT_175890 [Serpula lacrymans var. lacrymans S7.3]|uniref:Uncharacterized protein n=2 Tax=Serpula lacrymans var. lacrymans TaxID=341189 RepID=F8PJI2_SERL3|nr:uncharacterized protein SERLADRAFT_458528 [Serpula lacrymans var. lacrymans S7.9]EGO04120.1 hypothetical protein SERLA73DRAFT_175890 [Serpula lacrymans var. lacrymans S7.3]EGO30049.1 hypothetical protein SERLADRAFT_458528 [Serpula lacrymans var. lacrymans S7.9]
MDSWRRLTRKMFGARNVSGDYELLAGDTSHRTGTSPSTFSNSSTRRRSWRSIFRACIQKFTIRRLLIAIALIPVVLVIAILWPGIPPSYDDIRLYERRLPQHDLSLSSQANPPNRYLRFPGHLWGHGFNNILQEIILMSYLASISNMSFVFEDYTWSHTPFPYTIYDFALRPTHVPINAFISGPPAGGPTLGPRAISAEFWEKVCPNKEKKRVISSEYAPNDADGIVMIDWWHKELVATNDTCVEVDSTSHDVFDRFFFGGPRLLSLWPELSSSPILTNFSWSPLVLSAIARNFALLRPSTPESLYDFSSSTTFKGMVAVHLRRGDYQRHCPNLALWGALYMGMNEHPSLPDRFDPSPYSDAPHKVLEGYYLEHCYPSTSQIVARLHEVRKEHPNLHRVYLLSNGWAWWLDELKLALEEDGWDELISSLDIHLDAEQFYVSMAVDMAVAEKAEVFVGNGFSSLTSNVVMLRMAKDLDPSTNRFL